MNIFSWISQGLGWVLYEFNTLTGNYGAAIIMIAILVRACLFPLTMKQLKSTAKMQELQPKLNALQNKYANDKEKFAQEQMKLYKEAGTSPFSGCLPTLLQMPILFCLYYSIMYPLENQLWIPKDILPQIAEGLNNSGYEQLNWVVQNAVSSFQDWSWNFNFHFLGIDLGSVASLDHFSDGSLATYWPNYVLSLLAGVTTFISAKLSSVNNKKREKEQPKVGEDNNNPAAGMNGAMQYLMPAMTLWFTTIVPTAMTLYWTTGYVIQIVQQFITNTLMKREHQKALDRLAAEKAESQRRKQLFAEEKVVASMNNVSKKRQKRLKEAQKEKERREKLSQNETTETQDES